jgi:hypothetical protein
LGIAAVVSLATPVLGQVTLTQTARNWVRFDGAFYIQAGASPTASYFAGQNPEGFEYRDGIIFTIPSPPVAGQVITSATLRINTATVYVAAGRASVDLTLWDAAPASVNTPNAASFADLGGGHAYATRSFTAADSDQLLDIPLNADALTSLNASYLSTWAIGGRVMNNPGAGTELHGVFGVSQNQPSTQPQLVITWGVPSPSMLPSGAILLPMLTLRRKRSRPAFARRQPD